MAQTSNSILRPGRGPHGGRAAKTVIDITENNNTLIENGDDAVNLSGVQIQLATMEKKQKRLPRADNHSASNNNTTSLSQEGLADQVERLRNDPAYRPGPNRPKYQSQHSGVVRREHRPDKGMRYARSEYMVTWRGSLDQNLSVKICDPSEFSKQSKMDQIKDVQHLLIEDEDYRLKELPAQVSTLKRMSHLEVKFSRIKALPQWLSKLTTITKLSISETQLAKIDVICQMKQLTHLDLSVNKLGVIPKEVGNLVNVVELKATGNVITSLPAEVMKLQSLEKLDLSSNKIKTLPNEICVLRKLRSLDISRNLLEKLPERFGNLDKLSYFTVSHNRLTVLPQSIETLKSLKYLILTANKIKVIPKGLEAVVTLDHLNMRSNQISKIEGFPAYLKIALLDSNNIKDIEIIGNHAEKLEVLSIKDNDLKHIPKSLSDNRKLKALYIDGNPVENVPEEIVNIEQLRHLTLNKTKLRKLPGNLTAGSNNRLSLLDVQDTNLTDEVIKSTTKGIDSDVVANNIKRTSRNSALLMAQEED